MDLRLIYIKVNLHYQKLNSGLVCYYYISTLVAYRFIRDNFLHCNITREKQNLKPAKLKLKH